MARTDGPDGRPDEFTVLMAPRDIVDGSEPEPARHSRPRRSRLGIIGWIAGFLIVLLLLAGGGLYAAYTVWPEQVKTLFGWSNDYEGSGTGEVRVVINPGDYGSDVAATLADKGVTKTTSAFVDLLLTTSPEPSLKPGTYRLKKHMSAASALAALQDPANQLISTVVLPEGSTMAKILAITAKSTGVSLADLKAAVKEPTDYGVPKSAPNLEGWLFPATYRFEPDTSAVEMVRAMVQRMDQALDSADVAAGDREKVLTLAGLVQKEGNGEDDAKVARVFLNRIKSGMRLQSDATVSYGAGGTTVVPTPAQYKDRNPYNTYLRDGLPAGPISSPGDKAIDAAIHPAKGNWLFFVTVNLKTGETVFSRTIEEHDKAAAQFQQWLKAHPDYAK